MSVTENEKKLTWKVLVARDGGDGGSRWWRRLAVMTKGTALYVLEQYKERVIIISSKDSDNVTSNIENALFHMV